MEDYPSNGHLFQKKFKTSNTIFNFLCFRSSSMAACGERRKKGKWRTHLNWLWLNGRCICFIFHYFWRTLHAYRIEQRSPCERRLSSRWSIWRSPHRRHCSVEATANTMATQIRKQNGRERDRSIAVQRATRWRQRGVPFHHGTVSPLHLRRSRGAWNECQWYQMYARSFSYARQTVRNDM